MPTTSITSMPDQRESPPERGPLHLGRPAAGPAARRRKWRSGWRGWRCSVPGSSNGSPTSAAMHIGSNGLSRGYGAIACAVYAIGGWEDSYSNAAAALAGLDCQCKGLIGPDPRSTTRSEPGPAIAISRGGALVDHWLAGIDSGTGRAGCIASDAGAQGAEALVSLHPGRWVGRMSGPRPNPGAGPTPGPTAGRRAPHRRPFPHPFAADHWWRQQRWAAMAARARTSPRPADRGRALPLLGYGALTADIEIPGAPELWLRLSADAPRLISRCVSATWRRTAPRPSSPMGRSISPIAPAMSIPPPWSQAVSTRPRSS